MDGSLMCGSSISFMLARGLLLFSCTKIYVIMKRFVICIILAIAGVLLLSSCGVSYAAYSEPDAVVIVEGGYHYTPWYYPYYGYRYYRPVPPPRHHHPAPSHHHHSTPNHGGHVSPPSHGGHVSPPPSHGGGSHGGHVSPPSHGGHGGPSHAPSGGHRR